MPNRGQIGTIIGYNLEVFKVTFIKKFSPVDTWVAGVNQHGIVRWAPLSEWKFSN